jgi:hypothetical protein
MRRAFPYDTQNGGGKASADRPEHPEMLKKRGYPSGLAANRHFFPVPGLDGCRASFAKPLDPKRMERRWGS